MIKMFAPHPTGIKYKPVRLNHPHLRSREPRHHYTGSNTDLAPVTVHITRLHTCSSLRAPRPNRARDRLFLRIVDAERTLRSSARRLLWSDRSADIGGARRADCLRISRSTSATVPRHDGRFQDFHKPDSDRHCGTVTSVSDGLLTAHHREHDPLAARRESTFRDRHVDRMESSAPLQFYEYLVPQHHEKRCGLCSARTRITFMALGLMS